eukprot:evm.model.NODE_31053_length_64317_cov_55.547771.4
MKPILFQLIVGLWVLLLLNIIFRAMVDEYLTRSKVVSFTDSIGAKSLSKAKTTKIMGKPVTYIAPTPRECTTTPVGVLSGYAPKRQAIRDTWGKGVCLYFIVGKKDGLWPEEEATRHDDLVMLDMEEMYTSILSYKTAIWFYVAHEHFPQAMHVLKTDDDCYVKMSGLQEELSQAQPDYWGYMHRRSHPIRDPENKNVVPLSMFPGSVFPDYCSGAGYVLSRKALECFVPNIENQTYISCEDVLTGVVMKTCNVTGTHNELIDIVGDFAPSRSWLIKHDVIFFPEPI